MGNTVSQRSIALSTIKPRRSFETENSTEGENSSAPEANLDDTPMKVVEKISKTGGKLRMSLAKRAAAALGSPKSPTAAKKEANAIDRRDDSSPRPTLIRDEQVQVNLAMADLMAYLQVVANNSNNLPVTRRDDPELTRIVSSLTSEEYARKSAAFIPADVTVIGGSFLKYGKVWDLPTSAEYTALDGAQEPGKHRRHYDTAAKSRSWTACSHFAFCLS